MRRGTLWLLALALLAAVSLWFGRPGENDTVPLVEDDVGTEQPSALAEPLPDVTDPVHLVVLNGTGVDGLANRISLFLTSAGCVVERTGNAPHARFQRSLLINRRLGGDRAAALARLLGDVRVIREWDPRASEDAVLVLGADHDAIGSRLRRQTLWPAP